MESLNAERTDYRGNVPENENNSNSNSRSSRGGHRGGRGGKGGRSGRGGRGPRHEHKNEENDMTNTENKIEEEEKKEILENSDENEEFIQKPLVKSLSKNIEETEEEKRIKAEHLKKFTKKEILVKSFKFGLKNWRNDTFEQVNKIFSKYFDMQSPLIYGDMINAITQTKDKSLLLSHFKKYMWYNFYKTIYGIISQLFSIIFIKTSLNAFKNSVLENIAQKDIEFFDIFQTGEIMERIRQNEGNMSKSFVFKTVNLFTDIYQFYLIAYKLYSISTRLSIIYIIIFIIKFVVDYFLKKYTQFRRRRERFRMGNKYTSNLTEFITNIRLVKSFGAEEQEVKKLEQLKIKTFDHGFGNIETYIFKFLDFFHMGSDAYILYEAGLETIDNKMGYGEFSIFKDYSKKLRGIFRGIQSTVDTYIELFDNWQRFFEIYDYEPKIKNTKNLKPEKLYGDLEFKNVTFSYPLNNTVNIFNNLSFKIPSGKVVAVVGYSGSGKTTISNLLQRFYDPQKGEILLDNINIKDLNLTWLHQQIGYVSQEPVLNYGTIEDNIIYGVNSYTKSHFEKVCELANLNFVKDKNLFPKGMQSIVGERGSKVSGGQKQRIAIARALMKDVKLLVFDEATSALDAESEAEVQQAIENIIKIKKITTIIIAHRLSTVKNADIIMFINKGQVVEMGSHKELLELNGEYKKLIQKQLEE